MRFSILTLFPEMLTGILNGSILGRARERGLLTVSLVPIRDHADPPHWRVDDAPYGGGPGMVMRAEYLERAVTAAGSGHLVYLSPQGRRFTQRDAQRLATMDHVILVCGRYEGVDERWVTTRVDEELSLGDFVLTGGEIPALAIVDAVARLLPGVVGDADSVANDSFTGGLLDCPHYTRPGVWRGIPVPPVLLTGDHGAVAAWRRRQALLRTLIRRPDLVATADLTRPERRLLEALVRALANEADLACEWKGDGHE